MNVITNKRSRSAGGRAILDHRRCRFVVVADRVRAINLIPLEQANRNLPTERGASPASVDET